MSPAKDLLCYLESKEERSSRNALDAKDVNDSAVNLNDLEDRSAVRSRSAEEDVNDSVKDASIEA